MLTVREVVAGYGELEVLRGITATFAKGQITTVIGANGAGKSTLLRTIFGLLRPQQGSIELDGTDITGWSTRKILREGGIAFVPQGRTNFPAMTVEDNLRVSLDGRKNGGTGKADLERILDDYPMLRERRKALAGNLSGGQQQILEMAMALLQKPRVLLIDEPSLGLSPAMLDQVFARIVDVRRLGITVAMVEQNAKQALGISDHGIVLELGRTRMQAPAREILAHPGIKQLYLGG